MRKSSIPQEPSTAVLHVAATLLSIDRQRENVGVLSIISAIHGTSVFLPKQTSQEIVKAKRRGCRNIMCLLVTTKLVVSCDKTPCEIRNSPLQP
jgi:hypothetical protein